MHSPAGDSLDTGQFADQDKAWPKRCGSAIVGHGDGQEPNLDSPSPCILLSLLLMRKAPRRKWLSGRASPCQGEGRGFESRLPLPKNPKKTREAAIHIGWLFTFPA
jgi:hypothetical protein